MKALRVTWPAVMILVGACSKGITPVSPAPPPPPPAAPWVVGLVMDSLTPASRLYGSPLWAFYVLYLGPDGASGLLGRGTAGRDDIGRFARCLGPAHRFPAQNEVAFVALGDTLYSTDSAAYSRNVARLDQGGESMRLLFVSLARGDSQAVLPGLVVLVTPTFDPRVPSTNGRGATAATAVLRHWAWRDGGRTFVEDTARASLTACGLT